MRKILVFQHVSFEILGTLNPLLKAAGLRIKYVNFGRHPDAEPSLDGYAGLVVLGGPMNVDEVEAHPHLATEVRLIREAVERDMAVLGICLGAQLLASALGAGVRRNPEVEIGWHDLALTGQGAADPVTRHLGGGEKIFQWHQDTFDIPEGAVHLASSPRCRNQAFRYGERAYGFQFHLEVDEPLIHRWLTVPVHVRELEALAGRVDADAVRRETSALIERSVALSERTFGAFLQTVGLRRRRRKLPTVSHRGP